MAFDTQKDIEAKQKRIAAIAERLRHLETAKQLMGKLDARETAERRRLLQEREWYARGHAFADWPAFLAEMEAAERKGAAEAAEAAKTEAERRADAEKRQAENEAALRAEFERETDPFTLWQRSRATRTF